MDFVRAISFLILFLGVLTWWAESPAQSAPSEKGQSVNTKPWFKTKVCSSLEIKEYKSTSEHPIVNSIKIQDQEGISNLMAMIERVPSDGEMMAKLGPQAHRIDLVFSCGKTDETIKIIEHRLKTPSTGFNLQQTENEKLICAGIQGLLAPAVGKIILKVHGLEVKLGEFSITWQGSTVTDPAPVTAAFRTDAYLIKDPTGHTENLRITSGQLSAQPQKFRIGNQEFTLLTHTAKNGERLYPNFFQVTK